MLLWPYIARNIWVMVWYAFSKHEPHIMVLVGAYAGQCAPVHLPAHFAHCFCLHLAAELGTLVSGALYTFTGGSTLVGFGYCFVASAAAAFASTVVTAFIHDDVGGLPCGPCLTLVPAPARAPDVEAGSPGAVGDGQAGAARAPDQQAMVAKH